MRTCSCSKPIQLKIPLKTTLKLDKTKLTADIHAPSHMHKSQILTGSKAQIKINGNVIGTLNSSSFEYNWRLACSKCDGRGWIATTKTEKKLLEIFK